MKKVNIIIRIYNAILHRICKQDSRLYTWFLRHKGIRIGKNFKIFSNGSLANIIIDISRPSLVTIGDNVSINKNFCLLTHDFVSGVFLNKYHSFVPSSGRVTIGNNVGFGMNCTVLKGVTIGDNCFIGAGSIVSKDIPSNSVAVGSPCKPIMSLDNYYERRKTQCVDEALDYARSIKEIFGRKPVLSDFWEEFPLFLKGTEDVPEIPIKGQLKDSYHYYQDHNEPVFDGFEDFLKKAGV